MSVFIARKCACGGKLEFDPEKKIWICKYCGTVVEREATFDKVKVDGIEGIDDVVRQTLKDIANQKMESAWKNLEDCERKGHAHIGTLFANISYYLANISYAKTQDEIKGSIDKVKIFRETLVNNFPLITEDEINLYESFGEDANDIFANLLVVFDTLGDLERVNYIFSKLQVEKVFSPYANKMLLKVAIRSNKFEIVDSIISNIGHIDRKTSLQEIMEHYPANEKKCNLIHRLFNSETADSLTKRFFENYFTVIKDNIDIKAEVVQLLNTTNIHINAETIVKHSQEQLDSYDNAKKLFNAIYDKKISDQETDALMAFCLIDNKKYDIQNAFIDSLIENNVFVVLNAKIIILFLDNSSFSGKEREKILQKMLRFNIENKSLDAIYNYYLNTNADEPEIREKIIDILLQKGSPISIATIKHYVLQTKVDGIKKIDIIEKIFNTGLNKAYIGDLLSEYMLHTNDDESIKKLVVDYLIKQGFKANSNVLSEYVSKSNDDIKIKIEKTKQLIQNGTPIKADCINEYIMSIKQPEEFSKEMFNMLLTTNYSLKPEVYLKYLLSCKDSDKVRHNEKLLQALSIDPNERNLFIHHNANSIKCNIFQAYVLNSVDRTDIAEAIVEKFSLLRVKLNSEIIVNNTPIKFKKYVNNNKESLSSLSLKICKEKKMFSLF